MALLTREEVQAIRDRAEASESTAEDVRRLLLDLNASPPVILIAPEGASPYARSEMMRALRDSGSHHGATYVLPHGWCEASDEQAETLARRIRHVERSAREQCAKVVERGNWPDGLPSLLAAVAADIRALNEDRS